MNFTLTTLAVAATATLWLAAPTAALAGEKQGVQCPAGATPQITNNSKTLKCLAVQRFDRVAVCSPVVFRSNGDVNLNVRVEHLTAGRDICRIVGGSATAAPQFVPLPGDPPAASFTQVTQAGVDVFRATRTVHVYPVGGPIYNPLDDESKGVSCPTGFDGDTRFNGRGIRCDKPIARKAADCDVPWSLLRDRSGTEDRRILANQTGQTKPQGITFVQLRAENVLPTVGWSLDKNTGADAWLKTEFAYPRSSN